MGSGSDVSFPAFFPICWLSLYVLGEDRGGFSIFKYGSDAIEAAWCDGKMWDEILGNQASGWILSLIHECFGLMTSH